MLPTSLGIRRSYSPKDASIGSRSIRAWRLRITLIGFLLCGQSKKYLHCMLIKILGKEMLRKSEQQGVGEDFAPAYRAPKVPERFDR